MSLKSKIEAVIYASEEPVTLAQLVVLLSEEAQSDLDAFAAQQAELPLDSVENATSEAEPQELLAADTALEREPANAEQDPIRSEDGESKNDVGPGPVDTSSHAAVANATGLPVHAPANEGDEPFSAEAATESPSLEVEKRQARERERAIRDYLRSIVDTLIREYAESDRGLEIREVAGGFRFGTKPEYHDAVRGFVKSLKPALKLSLQALETLAVVAYKQPVTAAEISEIRGVDSSGVLGGLLTRKLIQTAGRKQVIGRPMLYKTTREFLVRFGLRDVQELPSMEEFERMAGELSEQEDLPMETTDNIVERANARGDAEHIRGTNEAATQAEGEESSPAGEAGESAATDTAAKGAQEDSRDDAPEPEADANGEETESSPRSEAEPPAHADQGAQ